MRHLGRGSSSALVSVGGDTSTEVDAQRKNHKLYCVAFADGGTGVPPLRLLYGRASLGPNSSAHAALDRPAELVKDLPYLTEVGEGAIVAARENAVHSCLELRVPSILWIDDKNFDIPGRPGPHG
jgi:hypothetical protein